MPTQTELFQCECYSPEHSLTFTLWDYGKNDVELYVNVHLLSPNFFKRIWIALKYVFGYKCQYGNFDEMLFKREDADRLIQLLQTFKDKTHDFPCKDCKSSPAR